MSKKLTFLEIKERLNKLYGDTVSLKEDTYINTHKKAIFIDKDFGEWFATPHNVLQGYGHKTRGYIKNSENSKMSIEEIQIRLNKLFGDLIFLKKETYINTHKKAIFIDKDFGEWEATPNSVLSGHLNYKRGSLKRQKTNISKYGVPFHVQNKEMALKMAKSQQKIFIRYHWKTNEELICQASWEPKVVDYLNENKINFEWQSKIFTLPNGKTYRPDLHLVDENVWVEIKGRFRIIDKQKWDWFKSEYPTAELWNKEKLKEMGIL